MIARLSLLPIAVLAGCATDPGHYPSLAPRAVEKQDFAEPTVAPVEVKPDPALDASIAKQRTALGEAARSFDPVAAHTDALVRAARGDAVGGERWIAAQTALADLDAGRAATLDSVSALEQLALGRAEALAPAYPALEAAQAAAQQQLDAETARIRGLQATLPGG